MTIDDYFELSTKLIHNYVGSCHDQTLKEDEVLSDSLNRFFLYQDDNKSHLLLIVTVALVGPKEQLISLIHNETQIDSILINWDKLDVKVKFPIEEISLPEDLIHTFNAEITKVSRKNALTDLFKTQVKSSNSHAHKLSEEVASKPQTLIDSAASNYNKKIPDKPDFEDEYEMRAGPAEFTRPSGFPSIGDRDLNPVPAPGMSSFIDPLAGDGDGGMYPSMRHPLFDRTRSSGRPGVPPGARYDDPLGDANLDAVGDGLPGYRRPSGGPPGFGSGGFSPGPGSFGGL